MNGAYTRSTGMGGEHRAAAAGRRGGGAATATKPAMGTGGGPPVLWGPQRDGLTECVRGQSRACGGTRRDVVPTVT